MISGWALWEGVCMTTHVQTEENRSVVSRPPLPWLTGEAALYGVILLLALSVRLGGLDVRIMDVPEADQAWQAWRLASGQAADGSYSPLLLSGQALLFGLFGAGEVTARLLPALVGSAMVLLPVYARSCLSRAGSLVSALILALSPTLVYSSRYGDGSILLAACVLGSLVLWLAYQRDRRPVYLYTIAVMDALAFIADPRVVGVLIVQFLAWAIERYLFRRSFIQTDVEHPIPWKRLGLTLGGALLLVVTTLGLNPSGLGAWADYPAAWAAHLTPVVNGQAWTYPLGALLMYEPLLLLFGVIGAVDLFVRRDKAAITVWMAAGSLVAALLAGGRDAGDVSLVCAFLALPAGRAVGHLTHSWQEKARLTREGLFVLVILGIMVYVSFEAAFYARSLYVGLPQASQFLWFWLLAVLLVLILAGLSWVWFGVGVTWRVAGAVLLAVLLLGAFSETTGLNYRRANDPRELHILVASDEGTRDALEAMADLSYRKRGSPTAIPLTVEAGLGPVWRWYLRDWEDVTFVEELTSGAATPLVLASEAQRAPALGDQYIGQDFVTRTWWQPSLLVAEDRLSWWLYRKSQAMPVSIEKAILWVKAEERTESGE